MDPSPSPFLKEQMQFLQLCSPNKIASTQTDSKQNQLNERLPALKLTNVSKKQRKGGKTKALPLLTKGKQSVKLNLSPKRNAEIHADSPRSLVSSVHSDEFGDFIAPLRQYYKNKSKISATAKSSAKPKKTKTQWKPRNGIIGIQSKKQTNPSPKVKPEEKHEEYVLLSKFYLSKIIIEQDHNK